MLNEINIIGNLGKTPECKTLESGAIVASFSVATTKTYKDRNGEKQKATTWHQCVAWDKLAQVCEKYLQKGNQVYIKGEIIYDEYTDKQGVKKTFPKVVAHTIKMLGSKNESNEPSGDLPF